VKKLFLLVALSLFAPLAASAQNAALGPSLDEALAVALAADAPVAAALDAPPAVEDEACEIAEIDEAPRRGHVEVSFLCPPAVASGAVQIEGDRSFKWWSAIGQSMLFLTVQHTFRTTEAKTRRELPGPFWQDYFDSLKTLGGWDDGGRQFTNYVAHPMQGGLYGFVQIQNDPKGIHQEFGGSKAYWKSRLKAMGWAAIWSTQFELGPLSQASIGNVGLHSKKLTYVDIVITPTMGFAWVVSEDILDRFVVKRVMRGDHGPFVKAIVAMSCTPMRSAANFLRFKAPWSRD
jgi:hypothetical protein